MNNHLVREQQFLCYHGWPRSQKLGCAGGPSSSTNTSMTANSAPSRAAGSVGRKPETWRATKLLCQIPSIGPIGAALLIALIQTPHRFRTKRQLWNYSGLGIETHGSAEIPLRGRAATTSQETAAALWPEPQP